MPMMTLVLDHGLLGLMSSTLMKGSYAVLGHQVSLYLTLISIPLSSLPLRGRVKKKSTTNLLFNFYSGTFLSNVAGEICSAV